MDAARQKTPGAPLPAGKSLLGKQTGRHAMQEQVDMLQFIHQKKDMLCNTQEGV
jgi:hypothetical protein